MGLRSAPRGRAAGARLGGRCAAALLLALAWTAGCHGSPPQRRHVLLLSIDTLRHDHLSSAGYDRPTTPFLDALLSQGLVFDEAVTTIPRTTPALASLLTGAYPHGHRVRRLLDPLPPDVPYLPELARERGWTTVGVVSNHLLLSERGLARGFSVYDAAEDTRDARATTAAALAHVAQVPLDARLFLWVHYIDPHMPYYPPPAIADAFDPGYAGPYALHFGDVPGGMGPEAYPRELGKVRAVYHNPLPEEVNRHVRRLYAADVRATDDAVADLVRGLEARFGSDWTIVFTSDHGESLGEHGIYWDHGDYVYEEGLRVPLAFVLPAGDPLHRSGHVAAPVSLVDVFPTLVDLMALSLSAEERREVEGRSLEPYLEGRELPPRPVFAESGQAFFPAELAGRRVHFNVRGRFRSVSDGHWKLIWTPGQSSDRAFELYDLESDPGELENLYRPGHPEAQRLARMLFGWLRDSPSPRREPSPRDRELLRSLGYVE